MLLSWDRCQGRSVPSARKTVLVAKKRIKIRALEDDPMLGWPSVRMNLDPRDKMKESKEISVSHFRQPALAVTRSRNRAVTFLHPLLLSIYPSHPPLSSFALCLPCSLTFFFYFLPFFLRDFNVTLLDFFSRQRFQDNRQTTDNRASQSVPH